VSGGKSGIEPCGAPNGNRLPIKFPIKIPIRQMLRPILLVTLGYRFLFLHLHYPRHQPVLPSHTEVHYVFLRLLRILRTKNMVVRNL